MPDPSRIDDLKRRVRQDPGSIAFAQLAEEYRRGGLLEDAIETCRAGLAVHPGYLSARVTLGRALLESGAFEAGQEELCQVLAVAPENLAANRALAEASLRAGLLSDAVSHFTAAARLAPNDPDLEQQAAAARKALADAERAAESPARRRANAAIAALEGWLEAIDAARTNPDA